jgi:UDP-N-acetylglucosamine 1-carboxyvinyltransferase
MGNPKQVQIEGGIPLVGSVQVGGSRALALKLIYAAVLSGEVCVLTNVPKSKYVLDDIELAEALGVNITWSGSNRLTVNSHDLLGEAISGEQGPKVTTAGFLVPALVHKFGKAVLPKSTATALKAARGRQYAAIWQAFGMEVKEDLTNYYIEAVKLHSAEIVLPYKSRVLTDMALLTGITILGKSTILNASSDVETHDLVAFCNKLGAEVTYLENGSIEVNGSGVFRGVEYELPFDREELAFFILATLLTNGNTVLSCVDRSRILPLLNWLSKIGASYEFLGDDMRVWHNSGTPFAQTEITVVPYPGFMTDFSPLAVLVDCFAQGTSVVRENLLATNLGYIKELTRLGATISVSQTAEHMEITILGPAKLKPGKLTVTDLRYALVYLLYALSVEGKTDLTGFEITEDGFEAITDRLRILGASVV